MPKVANVIILKETDVISINNIISDNSFAGEDIKKRAKAILLLSEGKQVKVVAKELGVRENTVTEIRRRFEAKGLKSLEDRQRSGRPVIYKHDDARQKIKDALKLYEEENKDTPTVKELSEKISLPVPLVRNVYHELGLIENRKHSWDFKTSDGLIAKNVEIVGIYLSSTQQALILRAGDEIQSYSGAKEQCEHRLVTKERTLAGMLTKEADSNNCLKIAQAIEIYIQNNKKTAFSEKNDDFDGFLRDTIGELVPISEVTSEYHVFMHGETLNLGPRSLIPNIRFHESANLEQWRSMTENIINVLSMRSNDYDAGINFCNGIDCYLNGANQYTAAFRWSKCPKALTENDNQKQKTESTKSDSQAVENITPGTVRVVASIMGDDGKWISYQSENEGKITQEDFKTGSKQDFLNSFDVIEQAIVKTTRQAAKGINERYMSELNKKKH